MKNLEGAHIDILKWLENWYSSNCDGDWEHSFGIQISTIDNPGWYIKINLIETSLEDVPFSSMQIDRNANDWIRCKVENNVFIGAGGALNLHEIISVFRDWAIKDESLF